ncbi:MAG TPA: nucleoside diphosphate kinase regulator [Pyrinomonadaceae bacterium]|jgi:regulator of nucleoside diphosphate kinase
MSKVIGNEKETRQKSKVQKMKKRSQKAANICISEQDFHRLNGLIELTRERNGNDREYLNKLESELDRAEVVDPKEIPADVITMRSKVRLQDLLSGEANTYELVFPTEANFSEGRISVLAPIGTAILGYKRGDIIEWQVPSGLRRLRVDDVIYQPEAEGDYHL